MEDDQAPVTEVDVRGRVDDVGHCAAVIIGPHPIAELRVRFDLVGVTELAVPVVDQPVDRVHERAVERMTHGERLRRKPACGGQTARVVDIGVRDHDVRDVSLESGEHVCEGRIRRPGDAGVDDRCRSAADDEEEAHEPVTEGRD